MNEILRNISDTISDLARRIRQLEAIEIPVVGGGGAGAPNNATYLVLSLSAGLTDERRFVDGTDLTGVDLGAGSTYTLNHDNTLVAPGVYGSATQVAQITVNQRGHITLAANVAISGVPPSVHNVLDSTYHGDVLTGAITAGDVLIGNATPKIARLAITVPGAGICNYFGVNNGETLPSWKSASSNPGAAAAILASNTSGFIRLMGAGIGAAGAAGRIVGAYGSIILSDYASGIYLIPAAGTYAGILSSASATKFFYDDNIGRLVATFPYCVGTTDIATAQMYMVNSQTSDTRPILLGLSHTINIAAGSAQALFGFQSAVLVSGAANYTNTVGAITAQSSHGGSGTVTAMYGVNGFAANTSNGTITSAYGLNYFIQNSGGGTITTAYAIRVQALSNTSGTVGTYYGLFIDAPSGAGTTTTAWGAYINGASAIIGNRDVQQFSVTGFTTQAAATGLVAFNRNDGNTNAIAAMLTLANNSTGTAANGFGSRILWNLESSTTADQNAAALDVLWTDATHATRTTLIRGQSTGNATNTGYFGFWNYSAVSNTAITIIPNATGDVTECITVVYAVSAVTAGDAAGGTCTLEPSDSFALYSDGTDTLTLAVAADGSVTVQRTAGADTFKVSLWMVWL